MNYLTTGADPIESRPLSVDPIELVAVDLDGTLLDADRSVGIASAQAIADALARGVRVVVATGRPPRSSLAIHKALGLNTLLVNHNGALIYDAVHSRVVYHQPIDAGIAREVYRVVRAAAPDVAVGVDAIDEVFIDSPRRRLGTIPEVGVNDAPVGAIGRAFEQPVTKVFLIGEPDVLGGIQLQLQQHFAGELSFAFSHMRLLQIMHAKADKATALERVAHHYGIGRQRVMAIGDAPNDLSMIQWAGLGIAVENAFDEVRRAASFVVPSNTRDGVAQALRKYVLSV